MAEMDNINTDSLLKDLGGCGLFQVLLVIASSLCLIPQFFLFYFMTFGIYNPGWRCLDNVTYTNITINGTDFTNDVINQAEGNKTEYQTDTCQGFETCQHIEFNPEASTIVTQWGLICGKSWVVTVIISCEMAAEGVGFFVIGYLADRFGRKICLHIIVFAQLVFHFIAIWSVSWEMYVVVGIFLGSVSTTDALVPVIMNEFVTPKWRIRVTSIPLYSITITIFSVIAMIARDWKIIRAITCLTALIGFIVLFWIPKSLRWLSVNNKNEEAMDVVWKIAKYNKVEVPDKINLNSSVQKHTQKKGSYTVFDLFKKRYRLSTFVVGFTFLSSDMIDLALSFGISALPGNIYENMIILSVTGIPAKFIPIIVGNVFGRKKSTFTLDLLMSFCLAGVVAMDFKATGDTKVIGTLVLVVIGKMCLSAAIAILTTSSLEIYPTVVRGTVSAYGRMMSSIGGIISPFLIPSEPSTFYISYLTMATLGLLVSFLVLLLPETKDKILQDTWDDSIKENNAIKYNEDCKEKTITVKL